MTDTIQHYVAALKEPFHIREGLPNMLELPSDGPRVLIFSPHPDDECIIGLAPLIWKRQFNARVINVAMTLGSNLERREARQKELEEACRCLGFECLIAGFDSVQPEIAQRSPEVWQFMITQILTWIREYRAEVIIYPHANDFHPAHKGSHELVEAAVAQIDASQRPHRLLTEFWHPMENPNVMMACDEINLALLLKALACHQGEIARNPYHLKLPAWMIDNTRRGAEVVGGKGASSPDFLFSVLYRWVSGNREKNIDYLPGWVGNGKGA